MMKSNVKSLVRSLLRYAGITVITFTLSGCYTTMAVDKGAYILMPPALAADAVLFPLQIWLTAALGLADLN